jgi:hypothetical protein
LQPSGYRIIINYTGLAVLCQANCISTGLIELTPEQVDSIIVDLPKDVSEQKKISQTIRNYEKEYSKKIGEAEALLVMAKKVLC